MRKPMSEYELWRDEIHRKAKRHPWRMEPLEADLFMAKWVWPTAFVICALLVISRAI